MSLESEFPKLKESGYRITSPRNAAYNCIAWAAGRSDSWWQPDPNPGYFWPATTPRDYSLTAVINAFASLGFESCAESATELGYDKIAIYACDNDYQHAARQLSNGLWTSKLGKSVDIEHTLQGLEGETYGRVVLFMRRPTKS